MRPIKEVHLGGKDRPVRFSLNALAEMCDLREISLAELEQLDESRTKLGDVIALVYVGLKDGARKRKLAFEVDGAPVSLYDVGEWIEDAPESAMADVMSHFQASRAKTEHVDDEEAEEGSGAASGEALGKA